MSITIGQTLYEPPFNRSNGREHVVTSIGRKWIQLGDKRRCTIDTLLLDCGLYSPRKLYASKEEYEAAAHLNAAWRDLQRDLNNAKRPEGMTVEQINDIRRALGLKVLGEDQ